MLAARARVAALRRTDCVCGPGGRRQLWTGPPQSGTSKARSGRRSEPRPRLQPSAAPGAKCPSFPETPAHPPRRPPLGLSASPRPGSAPRGWLRPPAARPPRTLAARRAGPGLAARGCGSAPRSVTVGGNLTAGVTLLSPPPPLNNFKNGRPFFRSGCRVVHL